MIEVRMPKPGAAITEATLLEFFIDDGEVATEGSPLYRIETDKAEMEIGAPATGTLRRVAEVGAEYPVGTLLATIE